MHLGSYHKLDTSCSLLPPKLTTCFTGLGEPKGSERLQETIQGLVAI